MQPSISLRMFVHVTAQEDDDVPVMFQFAKLNKNVFAVDFYPPMCALQAFAIGLSSFRDYAWLLTD